MDLIKHLGEDKLVKPGKYWFVPFPETVLVFIYLHTAVENIIEVNHYRKGRTKALSADFEYKL